ncbi:MAG: rhomboid family intramembrane serine protease [Cyanobacteria bacterium REEB67]|nr:rhomboid family intramembrane serine protease [Cyanobacteria bacterium REEB67]
MFPLKDNLRYLTFPWATVTIVAANILMFIFELSFTSVGQLNSTIQGWLLSRHELINAVQSGHLHPILTCLAALFIPMFLHGGFEHIFGNMCFFFTFAPAVEARLGWKRFTAFYLMAGLVAGLAQVYFDPTGFGTGLGASGAIGGVMGAYIVLFPRAEVEGWVPVSPIPLPFVSSAFLFILDFILMQAISIWIAIHNISFAKAATIGFWDHAGGMSFGALVGAVLVISAWLKPSATPPVIVPKRPPGRSRYLFEIALDVPAAIIRASVTGVWNGLCLVWQAVRWLLVNLAGLAAALAVRLGIDGYFRRPALRVLTAVRWLSGVIRRRRQKFG